MEYSILGKIRSISTPGNKVMLFEHDPMDKLTSVVNGWGNRYNYSYDRLHELLFGLTILTRPLKSWCMTRLTLGY